MRSFVANVVELELPSTRQLVLQAGSVLKHVRRLEVLRIDDILALIAERSGGGRSERHRERIAGACSARPGVVEADGSGGRRAVGDLSGEGRIGKHLGGVEE